MSPYLERILSVEMPPAIAALKRTVEGIPIPWFVADPGPSGVVDLRIADGKKRHQAFKENICWICGAPLGRHRVFIGGPCSVFNSAFSDWCAHEKCCEYAVRACPALNGIMVRRPGKDHGDGTVAAPGHIDNLPQAIALYYATGKCMMNHEGIFRPGPPSQVRWFQGGEEKPLKEVEEVIRASLRKAKLIRETDPTPDPRKPA